MTWGDPPDDGEYADEEPAELAAMQVLVTEPTLLAVLYDAHGDVLRAMYDRRIIPFGFQSTSPSRGRTPA